MKKIIYFVLSLVLLFFAPVSPLMKADAATVSTRGVILLKSTQDENEITITVSIKDNKGLCALLLTLNYDSSALKFKEYTKGEALQSEMNLVATNTESGDGYDTIPFKFNWESVSKKNDETNGVILTLKFEVLEDVKNGTYPVTFSYNRSSDVCYYENSSLKQGTLVIDKANVVVGDGKIEVIVIDGTEDNNLFLIIFLIIVAVILIVACVVSLIILRKNKKKGWHKING